MSSENARFLTLYGRIRKAVWDYCIDCSGGCYGEVKQCEVKNCKLWSYRLKEDVKSVGKNKRVVK